MWSRTSTAYIRLPLVEISVAHVGADTGRLGCEHARQRAREFSERDFLAEQCIYSGRRRAASVRLPAASGCSNAAVGTSAACDLARNDFQPPRMERAAERDRGFRVAVPARFHDRGLAGGKLDREARGRRRWRWCGSPHRRHAAPLPARRRRAPILAASAPRDGSMSTAVTSAPGMRAASAAHSRPHAARRRSPRYGRRPRPGCPRSR